ARDVRAHLTTIPVQRGRKKLAVGGNQRHREMLLAHALRRVADRFEKRPGRGVHPAEVGWIENNPRGVAIAPLHLARKNPDNRTEFNRRNILKALTVGSDVGRIPLPARGPASAQAERAFLHSGPCSKSCSRTEFSCSTAPWAP